MRNGMTKLTERESGRVIIEALTIARTPLQRMRGLLGRNGLPANEGMFIERCSSIHTFFMRFPLDVIFLDRDLRVNRVIRHLKPWRLAGSWGAAHVIEAEAGSLEHFDLAEGLALALEDGS